MPLLGVWWLKLQLRTANCKYWTCNYSFFKWKKSFHTQILAHCIYTKNWGHRHDVCVWTWSPKQYKARLRSYLWCAWGGGVAFHLRCCPAFLMPWAGPATAYGSLRLEKIFQVCISWSQRCDYSSQKCTWGSFTWHGPSTDSNVATAACRWAWAAENHRNALVLLPKFSVVVDVWHHNLL